MAAKRCIVDYRVYESEFEDAVKFYCGVLGKTGPDYNTDGHARIEAFSVVDETESDRYMCEVRVSTVSTDDGGECRHHPVIYWGTDNPADTLKTINTNLTRVPDDEPLHVDPITYVTQGGTTVVSSLGSAVDPFSNRTGVTPNPTYPPKIT